MTMREELTIFWVFGDMAVSFLLNHFLGSAMCAIDHIVALTLSFIPALTYSFAGIL